MTIELGCPGRQRFPQNCSNHAAAAEWTINDHAHEYPRFFTIDRSRGDSLRRFKRLSTISAAERSVYHGHDTGDVGACDNRGLAGPGGDDEANDGNGEA